jgi:hypothetical protein
MPLPPSHHPHSLPVPLLCTLLLLAASALAADPVFEGTVSASELDPQAAPGNASTPTASGGTLPDIPVIVCTVEGNRTHFTPGQYEALQILTLTGASLSALGSLFIFISYFLVKELQMQSFRLIAILSFADFFGSLSYIIGSQNSHDACVAEEMWCTLSGGMTQFFDMATFCWTATIATNMFVILSRRVTASQLKYRSYEPLYHLIGWGIPLVTLLVASFSGAIGDAGTWCWITKDRELERMLLYYVPLLCIMLYNTAMCVCRRWGGVGALGRWGGGAVGGSCCNCGVCFLTHERARLSFEMLQLWQPTMSMKLTVCVRLSVVLSPPPLP